MITNISDEFLELNTDFEEINNKGGNESAESKKFMSCLVNVIIDNVFDNVKEYKPETKRRRVERENETYLEKQNNTGEANIINNSNMILKPIVDDNESIQFALHLINAIIDNVIGSVMKQTKSQTRRIDGKIKKKPQDTQATVSL